LNPNANPATLTIEPSSHMEILHALPLLIPIFGIVFGCAIPIIIVCAVLYFKHRKEALWHETARIALEKGQPVPMHPDSNLDAVPPAQSANAAEWASLRRQQRRWKDVRIGLILTGLGLAFFFASHNRHADFMGDDGMIPSYILLGIGAAMLLSAIIGFLFAGKRTPPTNPNTQA
jgi:hypothetical protein